MRANRGRDTGPERALRSALHARGLRYRVGVRPVEELRRTADVVFTGARTAVFLDGCFWHGCPDHHRPATGQTSEFWRTKIAANRERDADTDRQLTEAGWAVVRVWEHQPVTEAAEQIEQIVRARAPRKRAAQATER